LGRRDELSFLRGETGGRVEHGIRKSKKGDKGSKRRKEEALSGRIFRKNNQQQARGGREGEMAKEKKLHKSIGGGSGCMEKYPLSTENGNERIISKTRTGGSTLKWRRAFSNIEESRKKGSRTNEKN